MMFVLLFVGYCGEQLCDKASECLRVLFGTTQQKTQITVHR